MASTGSAGPSWRTLLRPVLGQPVAVLAWLGDAGQPRAELWRVAGERAAERYGLAVTVTRGGAHQVTSRCVASPAMIRQYAAPDAPVGTRVPCSHRQTVMTFTPTAAAILARVTPHLTRTVPAP